MFLDVIYFPTWERAALFICVKHFVVTSFQESSAPNDHDEDEGDLVDNQSQHVHPIMYYMQCLGKTLGISLCSDPRFVVVVISVMSVSILHGEIYSYVS
jgi:hypothetical protein